ncbi:hypothetical protein AQ490_03160 [Wenjunlia vitaminophila]|uniref:DUF4184 family protein n=1 Tax=Wenjunlia vitaminophila TaxID=76728 RepID=A0A0T6LT03_WENVI|nr:DUF4184 family protein [Wenjunlia vitaminophila]KRV49219.1 hypothetical protein AQ490_03160 [Wenjunlia vitaminophila]
MPFTVSHAAAVLPLVRADGTGRGPLLASALVAGSFAPDVPFYADTLVGGVYGFGSFTHTPWGLLTVDVLLTAALLALWWLLREPLLALVPGRYRGGVAAYLIGTGWRQRSWPALAGAFWLSAVVGAATHVGWDSFTHEGRAGVRAFPTLERTAVGHPLHRWAQYGGSALALGLIAWCGARAVRRLSQTPVPERVPRLSPGGSALACTGVLVLAVAAAGYRCVTVPPTGVFAWVSTVLFGAGAGLTAGLVLFALTVRLRRGEQRSRSALGP